MKVRPGPESIEPGLAPGGVVVHIYDQNGRLLVEQNLAPTADVAELAGRAVDRAVGQLAEGAPVCIVAFDGDTGRRIRPLGWSPSAH